jgi:hypothetical protein
MRAAVVAALVVCGCQSPRAVSLDGMVVMLGDSDASGVRVRAAGPSSASAVTDAHGDYVLPALVPGDYELLFSADDTLEKTALVKVTVTASGAKVPEVRFTAAGSVAGTITLAGQPGGGATVLVDGGSAVATSDGSGKYRLDGVAAGSVTVEAVLAGYAPGSLAGLTITRGHVTEAPPLDLAVDGNPPYAAAALSGIALRIDRADSSGTTVTATLGTMTFTTTTAADGTYHFDGVPTGVYRIDFSYDGHAEYIPEVLALGGSTGQIIDGALYPLATNPIKLPVARRLTGAGDVLYAVDGANVLLQTAGADTDHSDLSLLSLTSGTLTPIADDLGSGGWPALSPDRTHLLYEAGGLDSGGALRLVALDGSAPVTLAPVDVVLGWGYSFWPDGTRVVYRPTTTVLDTVVVGGGTATPLATGIEAWWPHPDGKRIVYEACVNGATTPCTVWARTVDGGVPLDIIDGIGQPTGDTGVALSPDGSHAAAFLGYDDDAHSGQLVIGSVDSGARATLWQGVVQGAVGFSPDGRWIALITDGSDLRLADLTSATPSAAVVGQAATLPTFTSDGSRFVYQRDLSAQLPLFYTLLQQPNGGGAEVTLGTRVSGYVLSPDGTHTVFVDQLDASTGYGRLRIADAAGTTTTLAPGGARAPSFSPDGAYVEYQTADPARADGTLFFSVPATGGAAVQLAETYAFASIYTSPGGARVAYYGLDGIAHVIPTAGGTAQAAGVGTILWATDSRLVLDDENHPAPFSHQSGVYVYEVTP